MIINLSDYNAKLKNKNIADAYIITEQDVQNTVIMELDDATSLLKEHHMNNIPHYNLKQQINNPTTITMDIMNYKHDIPLLNIIPESLQSAIPNENENEKQQDSWQIATNMLTASQPKDKQSSTTNWPDEHSETIVQFNLNEASIPNDKTWLSVLQTNFET